MPPPLPTKILVPLLSHFLIQTFHSKTLKSTSILHAYLLRTHLLQHPHLHSKLFLSYASSSSSPLTNLLISINPVAQNPYLFNTIIAAFSRNGFPSLAHQTLSVMHRLSVPIDTYAICSSLTAAASVKALEVGIHIQGCVFKLGWMSSVFVGGALIDFYAKLNAVEDAHKVFEEIPLKNIVCANALLVGYVQSQRWGEGIGFFRRMNGLGLEPDGYTLSAILRICAETTGVFWGMQIHAYLIRRIGYVKDDIFLQSALVEMYGKCGFVDKAQIVFEDGADKERRDVVLWTSMLNAYGWNGRFNDVIDAFEKMLVEGTEPDELAFLAVLSACGHSGHVTGGLEYFKMMDKKYGLVPTPEHYSCVVDMLCRAGEVEKAWDFANAVVVEKEGRGGLSVSVWCALLTACNHFGNVSIGKLAAQKALELDSSNAGIYVELSNLCAKAGRWNEIGELRELMKERELKKDLGRSWLELS